MKSYVRPKKAVCTMKFVQLVLAAGFGLLFYCSAAHAQEFFDHSFIDSYEGSKTCGAPACHAAVVDEVTETIHYKLMGPVQDVYDMFTNRPVRGEHGKGDRY